MRRGRRGRGWWGGWRGRRGRGRWWGMIKRRGVRRVGGRGALRIVWIVVVAPSINMLVILRI
jgi:hypothetical protein